MEMEYDDDDAASTALMTKYLQQLPTFSAERNEDFIQWLNDITDGLNDIADALNYGKFTDDQKVMISSTCIRGDARRWLLNNWSILNSWPTFIQEMKKVFAPTLRKEVAVSQGNKFVQVVDEIMICDDKDMKKEEKEEVEVKEEDEKEEVPVKEGEEIEVDEENSNYITTTSSELNNIVLFNTCITESDENNFEFVWPDGGESWFIHDELPQRLHFIQCKQQEVRVSSTPNIDDDFAEKQLSACIDVVLSSIMNDKSIYSSYDIQELGSLLTLNDFYAGVISSLLLLGSLARIIITCRRIYTGDTTTPYFCRNVMSCNMEDRDWFRYLAVP